MFEVVFLIVLGLIWITFASIQDWKTTEVADWLNFSLIVFALGFRFFYSLFGNDFNFFYQGLIGLGIFFVIGNALYYGRFFAGGDAKLMIALGTILPFSVKFSENLKIFFMFFVLFLFAGAIYGIVWILFLILRNFKNFKKEFSKRLKAKRNLVYGAMILGLVLMLLNFLDSPTLLFVLGIFVFILPYFYLFAKAVDEGCMIKDISSKKLREGDWLYKNVNVKGKTIKSSWEGLSEKDIQLVKSSLKKVKIRQGIPYVPVFLISFVLLILGYFYWQPNFFFWI